MAPCVGVAALSPSASDSQTVVTEAQGESAPTATHWIPVPMPAFGDGLNSLGELGMPRSREHHTARPEKCHWNVLEAMSGRLGEGQYYCSPLTLFEFTIPSFLGVPSVRTRLRHASKCKFSQTGKIIMNALSPVPSPNWESRNTSRGRLSC